VKSRSSVLREHEAGGQERGSVPAARDLNATFYEWKAKYGGLEVSEARREAIPYPVKLATPYEIFAKQRLSLWALTTWLTSFSRRSDDATTGNSNYR
jgi:hypothetical protein